MPVRGQQRSEPTACTPGNCSSFVSTLTVERVDRRLRRILLPREAVRRSQSVIGAEAKLDRAHLFKTAQQKSRGGQQQQSHRKFGHHQPERKRACPPPAVPVRPPSFRASFISVLRGRQRRNQPAKQPGKQRPEAERETTTCQSSPMELMRGSVSGRKLTPTRSAARPAPTPASRR